MTNKVSRGEDKLNTTKIFELSIGHLCSKANSPKENALFNSYSIKIHLDNVTQFQTYFYLILNLVPTIKYTIINFYRLILIDFLEFIFLDLKHKI